MKSAELQRVGELQDLLRSMPRRVVAAGIRAGQAVGRVIDANDPEARRQLRQPRVPHLQAAQMAVEQDQDGSAPLVPHMKRRALDVDEL